MTTGVINGRTYAFFGLERIGGLMVYDVTDPGNAFFVGYQKQAARTRSTATPGLDTLTGGLGADTFLFASISTVSLESTTDVVTDFSRAESDKLAFIKAIFTGLGAIGGLDAAAFHTGTGASDTTDRVIYDAATGNLFYDADGTGRRAQVLVASFGNIEHRAGLRRLPYPGLIAALHRAAGKRTRRGDGSGWKAGPHNLPVRCWSRRVMVICCWTCSWLVGRRA